MPAADPARRTVLVTDAGRGSAIAIVRSLGRAGYRVVAADSDPRSLGFRSRYASTQRVYPAPEESAAALVDALWRIVQEERADLVIPGTDLVQQPLAAARERFAPFTRLAIADSEPLAVVTDKARTFELAARLGIPVPETRRVQTVEEAVAAAPALGWPVVLKPQASQQLAAGRGVASYNVTYAASTDELAARMRRFEGECAVLLQRFVPGIGYGVELLLSGGRPLAAFQHRRLREVPPTGGASSYRESVRLDPELFAAAVRLLEALRWTGLAMVEFKSGAAGTYLMEINGRVWGSLPLAVVAGVDFPRLLVRLLLDGEAAVPLQVRGEYRVGVRCRDLQRDLVWVGAVLAQRRRHPALPLPPRRAAVGALASLLDPRAKFDLWAWDDPLPGLAELPRIATKLWRKSRTEPR